MEYRTEEFRRPLQPPVQGPGAGGRGPGKTGLDGLLQALAAAEHKKLGDNHTTTGLDALLILRADKCACGQRKKATQAFCVRCYSLLSQKMQRALWLRVGAGFEAAYDAAKSALFPPDSEATPAE